MKRLQPGLASFPFKIEQITLCDRKRSIGLFAGRDQRDLVQDSTVH